jgi:hypothetical protein
MLHFEIEEGPDKGCYIAVSKFYAYEVKPDVVLLLTPVPTKLVKCTPVYAKDDKS